LLAALLMVCSSSASVPKQEMDMYIDI
jgi:hypothetical protein